MPYICIDAANLDKTACEGDVFPHASVSGATMSDRCERHYREYLAYMEPLIDAINRRYPVQAPPDFDPPYAGETWDDEDY